MTPSRYFIARFGQVLGIMRKSQCMSAAASEMQLLREAEAHLGAAVWERAEQVEPLSIEYWNLRKLYKEKSALQIRMEACEKRIFKAHEERAIAIHAAREPEQKLLEERVQLIAQLEGLGAQRDRIIREAREIRRTYDGLKMKLEFLQETDPPDESEMATVKKRLSELKARFIELKNDRAEIGSRIETGDRQVDELDARIARERGDRKSGASEVSLAIGDANKEYTALRAEMNAIDSQILQFQSDIGRYISRHTGGDPACAKVAKGHHSLIQIMRALRRSVALNHRLAGVGGG